ncbi:MAG: carbohydrate ABC transporter permease [Clostridia bacterium]|nr:carbohydrate ABC transporter permease [Clostridia bacterium]
MILSEKKGKEMRVEKTIRSGDHKKLKLSQICITLLLIIYTIATIIPFYFLFVRSFVATKDSTVLHLWIPKAEEFNMDYQFGNMATYYNLDIADFKEKMGLSGYINPNLTLRQLAEKYDIPEEKIINYLQPLVRYNGFITIWKSGFMKSFYNTLIIVFGTLALGGILTIMTGSVLARFRKKWHEHLYRLYIFSMIIPSTVTMLPCYLIVTKYLGLYDNYLALILLGAQGGAIPVMIFTSYIATIPDELRESVEMDGGTRLTYFLRILLPNMKTPFASYLAITLPNVWNNMLNGILYLKPEHQPITALINSLSGTYTTNYQAMYSGLFLSIIPILLVYLMFQNLFVKSAMLGAVKG